MTLTAVPVISVALFAQQLVSKVADKKIQFDCSLLKTGKHQMFSAPSELRLESQLKSDEVSVASESGAFNAVVTRKNNWLFVTAKDKGTWISLGRESTREQKNTNWVGAITFNKKYDYEINCTERSL